MGVRLGIGSTNLRYAYVSRTTVLNLNLLAFIVPGISTFILDRLILIKNIYICTWSETLPAAYYLLFNESSIRISGIKFILNIFVKFYELLITKSKSLYFFFKSSALN